MEFYQGLRVIAEFSDQTICYNPDGEWSYAYMQTNFDEAGNVENTEAVMQRPLRGWQFPIKAPETAMDEAYEDDGAVRSKAKNKQK